ncbi:MAG: hypothetical protein IJC02_13775 [Lachnospiraceae bacterium]|nr:hypothetical protein [Lachnospiraceae bacterium]
MEKKEQKLNKHLLELLVFFGATLFLTISFYVEVQCNTDDAGSYIWLYSWNELGTVQRSLRSIMEPWFLVLTGLDFIGVGNTGAELVSYCFTVLYYVCIFITLKLCMKDNQKNKWILLLAVFIMMPYSGTNKYHLVVTAIALYVIYAGYQFISVKKKIPVVFAGILFVYSLFFLSDRVLLILYCMIPIMAYAVIVCLQDKKKYKYLYVGGTIVITLTVGIKVIDEINRSLLGQGLSIMEAWGGYGGESYLTWIDIDNLFSKGIPSFFQTLMNQYNIPVEGGLIQYNSFYWLIRIFLVGLALISVVVRWKDIIKKGILQVNVLDAYATITVTILTCVNVMNGLIKYYEISNHPMNRYASLAWYLLVVILVRWINEKYEEVYLINKSKCKIKSGTILGFICILLILGYSKPIYEGRDALVQEPCQSEVNFLKEKRDVYQYGISSYWRSYPVTAMTNAEYVSSYGWIEEDENDRDKLNLICEGDESFYKDGTNFFNYIISCSTNSMTMSEENIEEIRGDYIEKNRIYFDGEERSIIYLYDYDIRWEPELIMEAVGVDYELVEPIEYHYDLPIGTSRIDMEVSNSENFLLEIAENEAVSEVKIQKINDNRIYVDVTCHQKTVVDFRVARKEDVLTTIHKIVLKKVFAAVTVAENISEGNHEVFLASGNYVMTFSGENIDKMQIEWNSSSVMVEQITDGEIRRRYAIQVEEPQLVNYTISGADVQIERVSYEEGDLFG